jgi:hypothetical protein
VTSGHRQSQVFSSISNLPLCGNGALALQPDEYPVHPMNLLPVFVETINLNEPESQEGHFAIIRSPLAADFELPF